MRARQAQVAGRLGPVSLIVLCLVVVGMAGQQDASPTYTYAVVSEWPAPATTAAGSPTVWSFGQVAAVATDPDGHILVLHRGAYPIMVFDVSGQFIRSWGNDMFSEGKVVGVAPEDRRPGQSGYSAVYGPAGCHACGAHSVRVDRAGNIWVVDTPGHVVYKMDQDGNVLMQLGTKGVAGTDTETFNLPTDVAFAPNGDVYVSDGYGNARVMKFASTGDYILHWGSRGTGPGEFGLPHNLAVDGRGQVYVTDRDNQRVQVFGPDGTFVDQWTDTGGVSSLFMMDDQHLWTGGALRDLEGAVVARLPNGNGGHGTTVTASGDVYVAQLGGSVQKFVREWEEVDAP